MWELRRLGYIWISMGEEEKDEGKSYYRIGEKEGSNHSDIL